jgi:hypothetical protein
VKDHSIAESKARINRGRDRRLCSLIEARALEYADHPGGATGMLVKEHRGKNAQQEIWKFDAALVSQINATMKQAAIEEGQWSEKRDMSGSLASSDEFHDSCSCNAETGCPTTLTLVNLEIPQVRKPLGRRRLSAAFGATSRSPGCIGWWSHRAIDRLALPCYPVRVARSQIVAGQGNSPEAI